MKCSTKYYPTRLMLISLCLTSILICQPVAAVSAPLGTNQAVSSEQIAAGRKAAESDAALDEPLRQKVLEHYDQAAKWLSQATEATAQFIRLERLVQEAPERLDAIRTSEVEPTRDMPAIQTLLAAGNSEQLELALTRERLALQQAREAQRKQADELSRLLVGSKGLSEEIAAKTKVLEEIDADLRTPRGSDPSALTQARALMLQTRRMLRQAELDLLKLRLGSHDLLTQLAQVERDLAAMEISERQSRLDTLNKAAQDQREANAREAREQAEALKTLTASLPESLQFIAQDNAQHRRELEQLVSLEQKVASSLISTRTGLDGIKSDFERTRQRVDVVGASQALGKMLKHRRQELPSPQSYRRTSAIRQVEISRATDRQIEIDELLRTRGDIGSIVTTALEPIPESERVPFQEQVVQLARARRDALNELQKVYGRYIGQITSLDLTERQLVEVAGAYIEYIDDQLIWIPGSGISKLVEPAAYLSVLTWLLAPDNWGAIAVDTWTLLQQRPLHAFLLLGLFIYLLSKRKSAGERIKSIARDTCKIRTDSFSLTLRALTYTLVVISPWPVLFLGLGWLLGTLPTASAFTISMANGLIKIGLVLVSTRFLIQVSLPDGLGDRHLRWPEPVRRSLIREIRWMIPVALPLVFLVAATTGNELPGGAHFLGRLAFIALMLASSVFIYRLLRRDGLVMQALIASNGNGPLAQLHFLWFPLLTASPLAYSAATAFGYYYTALYLEQLGERTFWFFIGIFLVKELLLRSLYIAERRLRLEDAVRRRDELRAQRAHEGAKEEDGPLTSLDIPEVDFTELSEQNKRLVRAGFLLFAMLGVWNIWNDLLPALGFLNATELPIHANRIVDGVSREVPVTMGDLVYGIIILAVTVLAAKNVPGVLEISLLQRLPLDPGSRYAITSISQYVIAGIGVFITFSTLGLQWSSIQWLVAALSVGLGFGLQEIVANFISGIILLFERPIRVGDVVTIDNSSGKVARIRIRATTITTWDKQELLIPNKEFITGRVINWTLTDKLNRIVVIVGVAHGTDVERAMELMMEAAQENENVLDDPAPLVSFDSLGDSALILTLRNYLDSMDNRIATTTALHMAINAKFKAAGISIANPQRGMHLSTDEPLDIRMHGARPEGAPVVHN